MNMDIETWINAKAEEYGYRPHTPEDTKKLLHALLAEIEKVVAYNAESAEGIAEDIAGQERWKDDPLALGIKITAQEISRSLRNLLRPSEPKGEEKP